MSVVDEITINAIYRGGVINPLEPVELPDNALVKVQITRQSGELKGNLAKYKGILAGRGDFSLEEIQETVHAATEAHLGKLINKLAENAE